MSNAFQAMELVRHAYQAVQLNPGDPNTQAAFAAAHQAHQGAFVESFDVAGISYPRTDGHKLSESEARSVISRILANPAYSVLDLRPSVVEAAYPLQDDVLRQEIEQSVQLAAEITRLDWRTDTLNDARKKAIRELLRMPTLTGSYADTSRAKKYANAHTVSIYRGFEADHLIPDKVLRGSLVRGASSSIRHSFATFMQDSQNKGSQHKFVTDAQANAKKLLRGNPAFPARNPTVGQYLEHVSKWMAQVYTTADLGVDVVIKNSSLANGDEFKAFNVKGFALAQAGFMTWRERQCVGQAVATALLIDAREFYTAAGWPMDTELPLFHDIAPIVSQQPLPAT